MSEREHVIVQPLGGGQEVGRSCILVRCAGKVVLLDCGLHPGKTGASALPLLEAVNTQDIDLVLITHAHIDHIAGLPYLTERTPFRGKIFMTPPTRAIMGLLLRDYIRIIGSAAGEGILYNEDDLDRCISKINIINFHQTLMHQSIQFSCYNAGHILGACMFLIEFDVFSDTTVIDSSLVVSSSRASKFNSGSIRVLYTGDYSTESDLHLDPACSMHNKSIHVLIVESTFGTNVFPSRVERESRLLAAVDKTIKRGGKCLIPMYAFGRAQELLLLLNDYWSSNDKMRHVPIYFVSGIAEKSLKLFKTFVNFLSYSIQLKLFYKQSLNPFLLNKVTIVDQNDRKRKIHQGGSKKKQDNDDDDTIDVISSITSSSSSPCVVFASPGSLQSGTSRRIFEDLCDDPKNSCIIAGYSIDGTLGRQVVTSNDIVINTASGQVKRISCEVFHISFAAHVDCIQNVAFISSCNVRNIVLVHGELEGQLKLRRRLLMELDGDVDLGVSELAQATLAKIDVKKENVLDEKLNGVKIFTPENAQIVSFPFYKPVKAELRTNDREAIFVESEPSLAVISNVDNLSEFGIHQQILLERITVKNSIPLSKLMIVLKKQFLYVSCEDAGSVIIVEDVVEIFVNPLDASEVVLEWELNPMSDIICDACVALILNLNCSPIFALALDHACADNKNEDVSLKNKMASLLESHNLICQETVDGLEVFNNSNGGAFIKIDGDDDLLVMPLDGYEDMTDQVSNLLSSSSSSTKLNSI